MHLFRKYLDNRGSALFMVISTMTAVMISCMAMYFSVISSRSSQYAVFNQQQSKQSAVSISDAVIAGMMDGKNAALKSMLENMWKLNVGEKISTNGNGFAAFDAAATGEDDPNLGSYMVEITRVSENTFDIVVTSSVNGVNDVYHTVIDIDVEDVEAAQAPPAPTQVFAATGYVPNDVFLDGGRFITDVFFDNEQTIVNAYGGKNMELIGNLATGGSLLCNAYIHAGGKIIDTKGAASEIGKLVRSQTFAIRNKYRSTASEPVKFADPSAYGESIVLIGGDCELMGSNGFTNASVYILGDLYIKGSPDLQKSKYYVNGNVVVEGGNWLDLSNVYCNKIVDATNNVKGTWNGNGGINGGATMKDDKGKTNKNWTDDGVGEGAMTVSQMITVLDEKTTSHQYYKWVINDSNPKGDKYVKELNESVGSTTAVHKKLHFSQNSESPIPTIVLKYDKNGEQGCIIDDVTCDIGNTSFNDITVVIDTGEDEDNIYTIRVKPNRDFDKDGVKEAFSWYPFDDNNMTSSTHVNVLVKGRGSVVVDVPEGVTYQDVTFLKFMHYGWYLLGGGKPDTTKFGSAETYDEDRGYYVSQIIYRTNGIDNSQSDANWGKYVHKYCTADDDCIYTTSKSTNKCSIHTDKDMTVVTCQHEVTDDKGKKQKVNLHGVVDEFCEECDSTKKDNLANLGLCENRVGRSEIDAYLATDPVMKSLMTGSDGEIIYPTTNIYLISCDESASIRLSVIKSKNDDGSVKYVTIMQNSFFGYVYAPYMTFKAYGNNSGGGMVRLFGGMTVSDYIIDDSMTMSACWPEKKPNELMSNDCLKDKLHGIANKSWKITLNGH